MNSEDFNKCRAFLEEQIASRTSSPELNELLAVYQKLIENKSNFDRETQKAIIEKQVREAEFMEKFSSTVHTNNTQMAIGYNTNLAATQQNYDAQQFSLASAFIGQMPALYGQR